MTEAKTLNAIDYVKRTRSIALGVMIAFFVLFLLIVYVLNPIMIE
ncbi:MAG: hypothetical protein ACXVI3_00220 [Halobacteriota archaeon]